MPKFLKKLAPFFFLGFAIVAFSFGILLLAYLLFFGAIIGLILFLLTALRDKFLRRKRQMVQKKYTGRIIDVEVFKRND